MTLSRELKVGLFICLTALLILASLGFLAIKKGVFEKVHTFTLSSKSGDGFTEGMPVVFSGFNIGKVDDLELNDQGLVLIKIRIPDRHVKWLREDSAFVLYRPLIGSPRIVVNTENFSSPPLTKDALPEVSSVNDINDAIARIEPVLHKVSQIAENVEKLTRDLADPKGDLHRSLANAQKITGHFSTKKSLLEMALSDEASIASLTDSLKKLKDITSSIDTILNKIEQMADDTQLNLYGQNGTLPQVNTILKDLTGKLKKLDTTVDNVNSISADASGGLKDLRLLRADIDNAIRAVDNIAQKLDALIGSKKTPEFDTP